MIVMIRRIASIFLKDEKPKLGRWNLKTCEDMVTSINSIYQNRDHCGDTICKTPKQASEYLTEKKPKLQLIIYNLRQNDHRRSY